jgi:hypothetical protein
MHASRTQNCHCVGFIAGIVILLLCMVAVLGRADDKKTTKTSSPPPKPAASSSASAPSRPAGGSGSSPSHASSTGGSTHTGPTTGNAGGHVGPTTSNSGGHTGPTTGNPGAHTGPTTSNAGAHTGPTTSNVGGHTGSTVSSSGSVAGSTLKNSPGGHGASPATGPKAGTDHQINAGPSKRVPNGSQQIQTKNGSVVQKRSNGGISDVHNAKSGIDVHHGINGSRSVSVERPDHSRIVAERGRPGYIQRSYAYRGHDFSRRTYYYQGRAYDRYYRGYYYHSVYLNAYAPSYYYAPAFYGWAYNPWYQPVYYPWGWAGSPWYGYYGYYFTPYPVYPAASFWLTDYLISTELASAYQAQQEAGLAQPAAAGGAPPTPEVKQMIADEVKNQLALENAEAQQTAQNQDPDPTSSGIARMLSDGRPHVFVAGRSLDVFDATGKECAISDGDALELQTPPPPDATSANLLVLSSKGGQECPKSDTVTIALSDLQEMQNHMRETIDQGLQELQAKQGKGGLPAAPPSATAAPAEVAFAKDAPPLDPNGSTEINQQLKQADQSEREVIGQAQQETGTATPAAAAGSSTITLGQSIDQVTSILGPPVTVIDLGPKKIYKYKDMKVTFKGGKVSDVE